MKNPEPVLSMPKAILSKPKVVHRVGSMVMTKIIKKQNDTVKQMTKTLDDIKRSIVFKQFF